MADSKSKNVKQMTDNRICCGCGACTVACGESCINFVYGRRYNFPKVDQAGCTNCSKCLKVCSGRFILDGNFENAEKRRVEQEMDCYLIHSTDEEIRYEAASGGFITGLLVHLIETDQIDGAVVARSNPERGLVSESLIAYDRRTLLECRASRYAPVSSCTVLKEIIEKPGRYAFVGTPCMIESLCRLQEIHPVLYERIVLTIGLVCAGMDSHENTEKFANQFGVDKSQIRRVFYRGGGWPGRFRIFGHDDKLLMDRPLLGDSLINLVGEDPYLRCWLCFDHWGHDADIMVSDPWTEDMVENERIGRSGVMLRTERGKSAVESAINSGSMVADKITVGQMLEFNKHLVVDREHWYHPWSSWYQMIFFRRFVKLRYLLRWIFRPRKSGLCSILKAKFNRKYYR